MQELKFEHTRVYTINIENKDRCNGMCIYLRLQPGDRKKKGMAEYNGVCQLFDELLTWDKRYTKNGFRRCRACKAMEKGEST